MMFLRALLALLALTALPGVAKASLHPQDGPHADLRVTIEDTLVRYSVGVNLAFLDEAIGVPREALGQISPEEGERLLAEFKRLLLEGAPVVINGQEIEPVFERLELFNDPDPGMIAVFPKMGTRALIRAAAVMRFDAPTTTETVEVTWPSYPIDQLAERLEATSTVRPRMYFEVVFTAGGKSSPAQFTDAEPTIHWSRSESAEPDPLRSLPKPNIDEPGTRSPILMIGLLAAACVAIGFAAIRRTPAAIGVGLASAIAFAGAGFAFRDVSVMGAQNETGPVVSQPDAERVFLALHESMYRAFDYTAESDIYDRLAMALEGELLGDLYEQIRLSLLQAEEEMKVGVVTGLEPIETNIAGIDPADADPTGLGFDASHRWRVFGTVYHWGHSHTRAHVYEANYRVSYTENGWRITDHALLSQQRIDPAEGTPIDEGDPIQNILDRLGRPDI